MKVYVLFANLGEQQEYQGVFSTAELAEEWITKWPEYVKTAYYIDEYELDAPNDKKTVKDFEYLQYR